MQYAASMTGISTETGTLARASRGYKPSFYVGWLLIVAGPLLLTFAWPEGLPGWSLMWSAALTVYLGAKLLTWSAVKEFSPWSRHLAYLVAWPGMDAQAFLRGPDRSVSIPRPAEWLFAAGKLALGALLLLLAVRHAPTGSPLVVAWVGMAGIVFVLHFGSFHLLSCAWRSARINAQPLMDWPILSQSVSEYWGRRWNRAFRDLAHRFLFRPLTARFGARWGLAAGFLFSGLVHDVVISLPAGGGYGLPTLFFVIQAAAMLLERSAFGKKLRLGAGWRGRAFTALAILGPAPLLFHPWFLGRIVVPFVEAIGIVR